MTVYVDSLFALNFCLDYLLLAGSARLSGAVLRRGRTALAAALGGIYAVGAVLPKFGFLSALWARAAAGALMVLIAFGPRREAVRQGVLFAGLSFGFGGLVVLLTSVFGTGLLVLRGTAYYPVDAKTLVLTAAAVYLAAWLLLNRTTEHAGGLVPVELRLGDRRVTVMALRDTGNSLRDPLTNRSVLVADWEVARSLVPRQVGRSLDAGAFGRPAELLPRLAGQMPEGGWRLIPYRAVGTGSGLLVAMKCDRVRIGKKTVPGALVAFSPTRVSDGGAYRALAGGAI